MVRRNVGNEEELKLVLSEEFFGAYDCTYRLGRIDFCVAVRRGAGEDDAEVRSLLWAEAKTGDRSDLYASLVQLVLTIGREGTAHRYLPPAYLGALDAARIAFIPYDTILPFLAMSDFDWTVVPSDHTSREFGLLYAAAKKALEREALIFRYDSDAEALREFIGTNLQGSDAPRVEVTKNSFVHVFQRWLQQVKPSIEVNWEAVRTMGIIEADFYLADLLSLDNQTLREKLFVLLQDDRYTLHRRVDAAGLYSESLVRFRDNQKAHGVFWSRYQRPPKREYWEHIITRRDLLVPSDVRERKGSFFTPARWVELSQQYLASALGEDWQEEYYVWDCAAGTGNLLEGLTERYRLFASTLDQADVDVMRERAAGGSLHLLPEHIFQFDFLNDEFDCGKLPADLLRIIQDEEKRKRLVVYINPPYAEVCNARQRTGTGENRPGLSRSMIRTRYDAVLGTAANELFAQFFMRIFQELPGSILAGFSKMKILQGSNFFSFRSFFRCEVQRIFLVPANTFDNVKGQFPIMFSIWDTGQREAPFTECLADVYDATGARMGQKRFKASDTTPRLSRWLSFLNDKTLETYGYLSGGGSDMQHQGHVYLVNHDDPRFHTGASVTLRNLLRIGIFLSVRHAIKHTWLNDRDQFLWPQDGWQEDRAFQGDCLACMLFHRQNRIRSAEGVNHWIPFREDEVGAHGLFESHFMTDYIAGKLGNVEAEGLYAHEEVPREAMVFSSEAQAVFDAGRALWQYYHSQPGAVVDASLYDIREHFQGRNDRGVMNAKSEDAEYMRLLEVLKGAMEGLRKRIKVKVYEYGFLDVS